ncbi:hypothetical protein COT30_01570 [Candidatus Micrarchaeota archaeon CG08_land_8_20_14_0_20_49_17]|nr:MAG: hypothetical protein AUJ13_00285 [Candidatus Micrarchaeota archaeon CG1_02_49_24]PIU09989.1 MAG: hypothetical protein COT30_01570 [Candidatus Micrarchaeota archaeon CG08_land_8_20_14_0_20_49_17]PIU81260.1 MAG: hypothetical protein COS70_05035 [Candidatus Micrarchaeota archaeon CG06_land_8_20_14_3_00_50_6]HII54080.1 hypothetical protein [Candidatus Micrarchaeota archaeon]
MGVRAFAVILLLMFSSAYASNLYSTLVFSAQDSKTHLPLEGVEFFMQCPGLSGGKYGTSAGDVSELGPGRTFICRSSAEGTCSPKLCIGCIEGGNATIYGKYRSVEASAGMAGWEGKSCIWNWGWDQPKAQQCCVPPPNQPSPPADDIPVLGFATHSLAFQVKIGSVPGENASIGISIPQTTYTWQCLTGGSGQCNFEKMPEGREINYRVSFGSLANEGVVSLASDTQVNISFGQETTAGNATNANAANTTPGKQPIVFKIANGLGIPYFIRLEGPNLTVMAGERASLADGTYNVSIFAFGTEAYKTKVDVFPDTENITLNLAGLPCEGGCNACGCTKGGDVCTFSPLYKNYACCQLGKSWNGFKCGDQSSMKVYIVLINYEYGEGTGSGYSSSYVMPRAEIDYRLLKNMLLPQIKAIDENLGLGYSSYYIINESFQAGKSYCDGKRFNLDMLQSFFLKWYKETRNYNKDIEPSKERYRVIGVDFGNACGISDTYCGFTSWPQQGWLLRLSKQPLPIYLNYHVDTYHIGTEKNYIGCGILPYVPLHEFGHTFGLCDDYDSLKWEDQNGYLFDSCQNPKPTLENSNCSDSICANTRPGKPCCAGVVFGDGTYSVMGSGDEVDWWNGNRPITKRRFDDKSLAHILKQLEEADAR